ncbi:MAG: diiron oxygenase [Cyanobacteria bacterium P01_A01_bin.83]
MNQVHTTVDKLIIDHQSPVHNERDHFSWSKKILDAISNNWSSRAQVKKEEIANNVFILEKDDFLTDLLPFKDHPVFTAASDLEKRDILSCGYLAYNNKTLEIESSLIAPACFAILNEVYPGVANDFCKKVISETLVDESFHILITIRASQITKQYRNLDKLNVPKSNLISNIRKLQSRYTEPWQKKTILLATAIVCEVFIGGYLRSLAQAKNIQPLSQITTHAHMMDELSHHAIFKELAKLIYSAMSPTEKEFFAQVLPYPVYWLVDNDLDQWDLLLQQVNFQQGTTMLNDYRKNLKSPLEQADFSALIKLGKELGIDDINTRILECKV